ncbi:MAG: hypothetical protein B6D42_00140 [Anaerolineae bacterium UTCFX5]|jgi:hypothetical protein|nr:MAG: hypothetical protein B6D42_00140 [Anaerolineae bacterium UTCFX5]
MDNPFVVCRLAPAIALIVRSTGRPAKTRSISMRLGVPYSTTQYYLTKAEAAGVITRWGIKGGWYVARAA